MHKFALLNHADFNVLNSVVLNCLPHKLLIPTMDQVLITLLIMLTSKNQINRKNGRQREYTSVKILSIKKH